jgi:demethylmenaquinone methyltransferase/2-methoxy-6-polyprenyl-1,4-benzoquinol methylase
MGTKVTPYYKETSKKEQVAEMFDNIAHSYDFLNHFFSLGIDKIWRKKALKILKKENPNSILDVATGTGDFALQGIKNGVPATGKITGLDISNGMLEVGRKKISKKNLGDRIEMVQGDSENLPFEDNTFDATMVAFGVRNFQNLSAGLTDMNRVIKPGATCVVLEFSKPKKFPIKQIFGFYFKRIMPSLGKLVSKDSRAYTYLPESVDAFPEGPAFIGIMHNCGYKNCQQNEDPFHKSKNNINKFL